MAPNGTAAARDVAAQFLAVEGWRPKAEGLFFTGNGRQAIASAIGALVPVGGRLGVEALTYPVVKANARRLGVTLVPLAMDEAGLRPDAIEKAHREGALSAVYLQPLLHNPLGVSLSPGRRQDLIKMAEKLDLMLIEDGVYRFLCDDPPLTALAPERCILVDSLSKRIAPGVATGFICAPVGLRERHDDLDPVGRLGRAGFAFEAGQRLIVDGTADKIAALKHQDAAQRQQVAAECLAGLEVHADSRAYHLWLKLPEPWRSETFVAAAARHGIARDAVERLHGRPGPCTQCRSPGAGLAADRSPARGAADAGQAAAAGAIVRHDGVGQSRHPSGRRRDRAPSCPGSRIFAGANSGMTELNRSDNARAGP